MYICICRGITEKELFKAMEDGHRSLAALQDVLGVATCCGCCRKHVMGMLHHVQQGYSPGETAQEAWLDMQVSQ